MRLFPMEEINGGERCPTYLYRWTLFQWRGHFSVYLHHFVGDDWSRDLHDHPKRFISIGLWGWYIEQTPDNLYEGKVYSAPWIRTFPATHIHRLSVPSKNCWTLVVVLKPVREWGFWHLGKFMHWRDYVNGKDGIANKMKSCEREFIVIAKFKDGTSQRIGTFTAEKSGFAVAQAAKVLTEEQRKKLDQWEIEEDFL